LIVHVVLDKRQGIPVWNEHGKIFLERNDAIKYFHQLMMSDEFTSTRFPSPTVPQLDANHYENDQLIVMQQYCYEMSLDKYDKTI